MKQTPLMVFLMSIFFVSFVFAGTDIDLTPQVEICKNSVSSSNCFSENVNLDKDDEIILKINVINNKYNLICLVNPSLEYYFYKDPIRSNQNIYNFKYTVDMPDSFCISKNSKQEYYIPLVDYIHTEKIDRTGKWVLMDVKLVTTLRVYEDFGKIEKNYPEGFRNSFGQNEYSGDKRLELNVGGEAPSVSWFSGFGRQVKIILGVIGAILLGVSIYLWGLVITSKKKDKPLKSSLIITIILILFALYGFIN